MVSSRDLPPRADIDGIPEVQRVFRLAGLFGIDGPPPAARLIPDANELAVVRSLLQPLRSAGHPLLGLHLSARKPSQRWPLERFAELARRAAQHDGTVSVLLWAPGSEHSPAHPGDDEKAARLAEMLGDVPHLALPTHNLPRLIAALTSIDVMCCGDGGAMHLAAALERPLVCWFGASHAPRWRPWGTRFRLLQPASQNVGDVSVDQAWQALREVTSETPSVVVKQVDQAEEWQP